MRKSLIIHVTYPLVIHMLCHIVRQRTLPYGGDLYGSLGSGSQGEKDIHALPRSVRFPRNGWEGKAHIYVASSRRVDKRQEARSGTRLHFGQDSELLRLPVGRGS